ncbi:SMI1/KNR4 family protein [Kitasatospora sp. NPDC051914]|uniref:SMI1/KNR4 family protein n=1 Tax=Kitasatospora sp. NPDC051914 TaxID=3154945 RepID=UPI003431FAF2
MSRPTPMARLRGMMPVPAGGGDRVDWQAAEAALGTVFPSDYREFIELYGAGSIGDHLGVVLPIAPDLPGRTLPDVADHTLEARGAMQRKREGLPAGLDESALVGWGYDDAADVLCWITVGPDPDRWPVAVWSRGDQRWLVHEMGMVAFLVAVLAGELDECPLSDLSLWDEPSQEFVPWNG